MKHWLTTIILCFIAGVAQGGEIEIEWEPAANVRWYDLQIGQNGKWIMRKRFPGDAKAWKGELPAGTYEYRIRTFNKKKKPSAWSESTPFVVAAAPVPPVDPARTPTSAPAVEAVATDRPPLGDKSVISVVATGNPGFLVPSIKLRRKLSSSLNLGVRFSFTRDANASGFLNSFGVAAEIAEFFNGKLEGPFIAAGIGGNYLSGRNVNGLTGSKVVLETSAVLGWQFLREGTGVIFSLEGGGQYCTSPDLSFAQWAPEGINAIGRVEFGFSF